MALAAIFLSLPVVLIVLNKTNTDIELGVKPLRLATRARRRAQDDSRDLLTSAALARLNDLEQALVALAEADADEIDEVAGNWFDLLCEDLAFVLGIGTNQRFRIAIWTDDETDPAYLRGLAYYGFDRNDPKYDKLSRLGTVAGWAVANRREHYARDVANDAIYLGRTGPARYRSMVAVPLGAPDDPWAVMTVDAEERDGLDETRRALIRRFGSLASTGAALAILDRGV
ncbi:MAG: GAF domain-containing protein [Chloroflexota bacterium]|nr:GAF domain-containing protein [Chloroflexota bacterium]